jgi:ribosomal protein S18 acetylase RimI-like enzyme
MSSAPSVARFQPDEWWTYRTLRLRALAESPDAFGSTLEAERARPDRDWAARLEAAAHAQTELPLVARVGDEAVGLAWARIQDGEPDVAHLFQVWVAPEHRERGAGQLLLEAVLAWARAAGARTLALDVTRGDTAAVRLYTRAGFRPDGDAKPLREGSALTVQPMRLALGDGLAPST